MGGNMLYRQKESTFIRIYGDKGYIVNKSDFKDYVTDESGSIFLKSISREPKSLADLSSDIAKNFIGADFTEIQKDVSDFLCLLEKDGFIVSGETEEELDKKDIKFLYANLLGNAIVDDLSFKLSPDNSQNYLENYFKKNPKLMSFQIELTSRCNERCIHCYIPHGNKIKDVDPSLFYNVIDQCHEMGVLNLTLSGGEALLHPQFCDFLQKAKDYDFFVSILSNLTQLNDEIVAIMKKGTLCSVQTSLYSMDPVIHDSITQLHGSFEKTKGSILKLIKNDIPVQISCPTMRQNKNCYKNVLNWAHLHKCRTQTDYLMMAQFDYNTENLNNRLSLEETGAVIKDIINNDIMYQKEILSPEFYLLFNKSNNGNEDNFGDKIVCGVCTTMMCMGSNGSVYPCAGWQSYIVGNMTETPLKEIWGNSPKVKYLRSLRRKDFPECLNCEDRGFCSLCMVRNANEANGDIFKINKHFCKVAAINRKIVMDWKEKQPQGGV
jgi:radical SAM protein with 4Fe4S-binding SPASM domain